MSYQAGDTYPANVTIRNASGVLTDPTTLTLKVRNPAGTITTYVSPVAPIVHDSTGVYSAGIPLTAAGMWVIQWSTTEPAQVEGIQVWVDPAPSALVTFATLEELGVRLGLTFTAAQTAQASLLLSLATGLIIEVVNRDDTWAATYSPIPRLVRAVCLEVVARVMQNPTGARSESETLGQYQHSTSYTDGTHGLVLTDAEALLCRRAIIGATSGSAAMDSLATQVAENMPNTLDGLLEEGIDDVPIYDWAN